MKLIKIVITLNIIRLILQNFKEDFKISHHNWINLKKIYSMLTEVVAHVIQITLNQSQTLSSVGA